MANLLLQITIPAGGKVQLTDTTAGFPVNIPPNTFVQQLTIQDNAANSCRVGDVTVSATRGILLTAGGAFGPGSFMNYGTYLSDWWLFGTAGDVIDICYIQ